LQKPDLHSAPLAQVRPGSLSPHEPFVQTAGGSQSALAVQAPLHALVPHTYGKQELEAGLMHVPAPSQVCVPVKVTVPVGQVAAPQAVPLAYFWQEPAWHLPLVPQEAAPWSLHIPAGSALPVGTLVQVPSVPESAQDWQGPAQVLSQQYPCAQIPLLHAALVAQVAPLLAGPHELAVHRFGVTHWVSTVQAEKQVLPLQV